MTNSRKPRPKPTPLKRGDVIKTNPRGSYWGCAVVLTDPREMEGLQPMCHIGITPLVMRHDYAWAEIEGTKLSILEFERGVRVGPGTYLPRHETCIGLYTAKPHPLLPVIGSVDPTQIFTGPLTLEVGDATDGRYPLCGNVGPYLGSEAVSSWLRVHSPSQWQAELDQARERYERLSSTIKAEQREKRGARRLRKRGA